MTIRSSEIINVIKRTGFRLSHLTEVNVVRIANRELDVENLTDDELLEFLRIANTTYRNGEGIISDSEYDFTFLAELRNRNPQHPYLLSIEPESAFEGKTVKLPVSMLSTEKKYSMKEVQKWFDSISKKALDIGLTRDEIAIRITPKLDGFAAYDDGVNLYTRGDGKRGTLITRVVERGLKVHKNGTRGQGAGEIVVNKSYFDKCLSQQYENTRNFQATILREKDLDPLVEAAILSEAAVFFPFSALPSWTGSFDSFISNFNQIFKDVKTSVDFDVDGIILEVMNENLKKDLGSSRHHHRWQIAYKENTERAFVRVVDIRPQTSRSGRVIPVVEIEPTKLSGATIKNVTAHHYKMVTEKGIGPGAVIEIVRSGMVIPKIESIIHSALPKIPEYCPSCSTLLVPDKQINPLHLICPNTTDCPAQLENTIEHFFNTIKNVDGFGSRTIQIMFANGIRTIQQVYSLDKENLVKMGFGEKKEAQNLIDQLERSRLEPLEDWRFLAALGVFRLGTGMCERIVQRYRLEEIFDLTAEKLILIDGFSDAEESNKILEGLNKIRDRFWELYNLGFNIQVTPLLTEGIDLRDGPIAGKQIVFSGAMKSGSRDDMRRKAKALGATVRSKITKKIEYLVIGENVGDTKLEDAKNYGIKIIREDEYLRLIATKIDKSTPDMEALNLKKQQDLFD
jgi:DNA ligase (NAD+)